MKAQNPPLQNSYIAQYNDLTKVRSKKQTNRTISYCENDFQCPFQNLNYQQVMQFLDKQYHYSTVIQEPNAAKFRILLYNINAMLQYLNWLVNTEHITAEVCNMHPLQDIYVKTKFIRDGKTSKASNSSRNLVFQTDADYRRSMFMSEQEFKDFYHAVFPNDTYIHLAATIILLWCGFSAIELDELKCKEFHDKTETDPAYIKHGEHIVFITDPDFLRVIRLVIASDSYCGVYTSGVSGKQSPTVFQFCQDEREYILRRVMRSRVNESTRQEDKNKKQPRLEYLNHFGRALKPHQARLPKESPFYDKTLSTETIMLSGIFCRLKNENLPLPQAKIKADSYVAVCNKRISTIDYLQWYEISNQ